MTARRLTSILIASALVASLGVMLWRNRTNDTQRPADAADLLGRSTPKDQSNNAVEAGPQHDAAATAVAKADEIENPTERRLAKAAALAAWLGRDFEGAFAHLRAEKFASLYLPGIPELVARSASLDQLIILANESALPFDTLRATAGFLSAARLNELAAATDQIRPPNRTGAVAALSAEFASRNLDSALHYAAGLADPGAQSSAYAAIADTLTSTNASSEAAELIASLPDNLRETDPVHFAAGNAFRDSAPEKAIEAYVQISDPMSRRVALVGLSRAVESRAPDAAIHAIQVAGLSPEGTLTHMSRILRTWSNFDESAAARFLAASDWLSAEQRQQLVAQLDDPPAP